MPFLDVEDALLEARKASSLMQYVSIDLLMVIVSTLRDNLYLFRGRLTQFYVMIFYAFVSSSCMKSDY